MADLPGPRWPKLGARFWTKMWSSARPSAQPSARPSARAPDRRAAGSPDGPPDNRTPGAPDRWTARTTAAPPDRPTARPTAGPPDRRPPDRTMKPLHTQTAARIPKAHPSSSSSSRAARSAPRPRPLARESAPALLRLAVEDCHRKCSSNCCERCLGKDPGRVPDRPQIDSKSIPIRSQTDPRLTPNRVDLRSPDYVENRHNRGRKDGDRPNPSPELAGIGIDRSIPDRPNPSPDLVGIGIDRSIPGQTWPLAGRCWSILGQSQPHRATAYSPLTWWPSPAAGAPAGRKRNVSMREGAGKPSQMPPGPENADGTCCWQFRNENPKR